MNLDAIKNLISAGKIRWTVHCLERMNERNISTDDVKNCILSGEIIELYDNDFPFPSCLILGFSVSSEPVHVVVGVNDDCAFIISAYHPNLNKFESDFKTRRN